jgi:hypothetical protein
MSHRSLLPLLLTLCLAVAALAQAEEIFSRHVRVFDPRGEFAPLLIRLAPGGDGWQPVTVEKHGLRLQVPAGAKVDTAVKDSRLLLVSLPSEGSQPQPELRIDRFAPAAGDPTSVDREYARANAEQFPQAAFNGEFTVTDSGFVRRARKLDFAMVGGTYRLGAVTAYRVQWSYLSPDTQLFVTFDCAEQEWPRFAEQVGRMLLSLEIERPKKK